MNIFSANPDMKIAFSSFFLAVIGFSATVCFGAGPNVDPNYFRPFLGELVALSPDGHHFVYTVHQGTWLVLTFMDVDRPEAKTTLSIADDVVLVREPQKRDIVMASIRFLRWFDANTLIYQLHAANKAGLRDEVWRVDAKGKNERKLVDADDFAFSPTAAPNERGLGPKIPRPPRVVGFNPSAPDLLFVEAQGTESAPSESFAVHVSTGKSTSLESEESLQRYLYDRRGRARIRETGLPPTSVRLTQQYELKTPNGWKNLNRFLEADSLWDFEVSPDRYYSHRSFPLAFDGDEETLYFASNKGRDTYGIYALDLRTKRRTEFAVEDSAFDLAAPEDTMDESLIVFDQKYKPLGIRLRGSRASTRWFDADFARLQQVLDERFTDRTAKIVDWDDARRYFLVFVYARNDPGRYYIFEPGPPGRLVEVLRCAPKLDSDALSPVTSFSFVTPAGVPLSGTITLPRRARTSPLPLVIYCRDLPGASDRGEFDREAEALASAGFAIARIKERGSSGLGVKHLENVKGALDRMPIEDTRAAVVWLSEHLPINRSRVALLGEGFGAYVATRALERYPEEFRCAVALDLPHVPSLSLESPLIARVASERRRIFFGEEVDTNALIRDGGLIKRPVFLTANADAFLAPYNPFDELRQALKRMGVVSEYLEFNDDLVLLGNDGKAKVFSRIVNFLNAHVYENAVDLAPLREVK